jgi:hypothetical protein
VWKPRQCASNPDNYIWKMEVLKRLPSSLELNPKSSLQGEGDLLFLNLTCNHQVSTNLCGVARDGNSNVTYVMHAKAKLSSICDDLCVAKTIVPLVMQQSEDVKSIIDSIRPKTGYDMSAYVGQYFDMRALAYAAGAMFSATSWNIPLDLVPKTMPISRSIATVWRNPNSGDIMLPATFTDTASEWVSFCAIAGWAKVSAVVYMSDTVPPGGAILTGSSMASFCLKVYAWILSASDSLCVADHHAQAFWRGMCSVVTLHGHSDEAGWIREPLVVADYPSSTGLLFAPVAEKMCLATQTRVANNEVLRWHTALMLKYAAIYAMVDIVKDRVPTIFKVNDGEGRPSEVCGIYNIYEHMTRWRTAVASMDRFLPSSIGDVSSMRTYFTRDAVDRHIIPNTYMCPYFWVEPSVIISGETMKSWQPCDPEKTVELPLFADLKAVYKKLRYSESNGLPARGNTLMLQFDKYHPRYNGASYLLSGSYDRRDGLACFAQTSDARLGCLYKDLAHAPKEASDLANSRWSTPHNPLVHPLEGFTTLPLAVRYDTLGVRHLPNFGDLERNVKVFSSCGPFVVVHGTGRSPKSVSTHVPPHLRVTLEVLRRDGITAEDDSYDCYIGTPVCGPDPGLIDVVRTTGDLVEMEYQLGVGGEISQEEREARRIAAGGKRVRVTQGDSNLGGDGGTDNTVLVSLRSGEAASGAWSAPEAQIAESSNIKVVGTIDTIAGEQTTIHRAKAEGVDLTGVRVHVSGDNEPGSRPVIGKGEEHLALNRHDPA